MRHAVTCVHHSNLDFDALIEPVVFPCDRTRISSAEGCSAAADCGGVERQPTASEATAHWKLCSADAQFGDDGGDGRPSAQDAARYPPIRAGVYMLQRLGIMWEQPAAGAAGGVDGH